MAAFFGEINSLSSRADDDEILEDQYSYDLTIDCKNDSNSKTECKLLICGVGELATAFVSCYLIPDESQHLCDFLFKITSGKESDSLMYSGGLKISEKGSKIGSMYVVDNDVTICSFPAKVPEEISTDLWGSILQKVQPSEVLVLTSHHMSSLKTDGVSIPQDTFLKALPTTGFKANHQNNIPRLEPPNFLSNLPAAILSDFEIKRKPALCVINYVNTNLFDICNVRGFEQVLDGNYNAKLTIVENNHGKLLNFSRAAALRCSNLYT